MTATVLAGFDKTIRPEDWAAYRDRFVMADGRVVDDANGAISHSEGQGWSPARLSADDRGTFERIFDFTRNQLLITTTGCRLEVGSGRDPTSSASTMPATATS
jgi:endo-1,4-beta-D-glucanase Y